MFYQCTVFLEQAYGMKSVSLEVTQPSTGPVCPGQEVILTCTVTRTGTVQLLYLIWNLQESISGVSYGINDPTPGPQTLGDFITTAVFIISTDSAVIISNATLNSARLSNNNNTLACDSPPNNDETVTITVAGNHK